MLIMIQIAAYMWPYCSIQESHIICFNDLDRGMMFKLSPFEFE